MRYTLSFESHGGSAVAAITADAGTAVSKPADPTRTDYAFTGWFSAASGGTLYPWPHTLSADITMHAQWRLQVPDSFITLTAWESEDGSIFAPGSLTVSKTGSGGYPASFTAEPQSGYTVVQWELDGFSISGSSGTAQTLTIQAADCTLGAHSLDVVVSKAEAYYSTALTFTVTN
jgi:uncharacterized repeat protein (TIGR02543 family)